MVWALTAEETAKRNITHAHRADRAHMVGMFARMLSADRTC